MRASVWVLVAAALVGVGGHASAEVPEGASALELADQGFLECARPDDRRKTCRSIGSFERIQEGVYNSTTLLAVGDGITLEYYTPVWLIDDAFCGSIREEDVMTAIVRVRGREVAPQVAASVLQQVAGQLGPLIGQESCSRYESSGAGFIAKSTLGGEYRPEYDTIVKMISASDGYRVAD
jgi:hypothetical protein